MKRSIARVKGLGFMLWQARHMLYHVLIGLVWAWVLRELWGQFNPVWIVTAVVGSLLPDIEHLFYFATYGKEDDYTKIIKALLRGKQWRLVMKFIAQGHKYNTNLVYHNFYFMTFILLLSLVSSRVSWEVGVILFGAMVLHYLFDVFDDIVQLGAVNPNWKRWGRRKVQRSKFKVKMQEEKLKTE